MTAFYDDSSLYDKFLYECLLYNYFNISSAAAMSEQCLLVAFAL